MHAYIPNRNGTPELCHRGYAIPNVPAQQPGLPIRTDIISRVSAERSNWRLQERYADMTVRCLIPFIWTVLGCSTVSATQAQSELDGAVSSSSELVHVPLFLFGSVTNRQGLVRIVNLTDAPGLVDIHAMDETGARFGPINRSPPADCDDMDQHAGEQRHSSNHPPISPIGDSSGPSAADTPIGNVKWITDPYELVAARIKGDTLRVTVSYSGGCRDHSFELELADIVVTADPPHLRATLLHDANNDLCEAWLTEDLEFDLTPVKEMHGGGGDGGTVVLHLISADGSQRDLVYTF